MDQQFLEQRLARAGGKIGFVAEGPALRPGCAFHAEEPMLAASVIKLPVMAAAFEENRLGRLDFDERVRIRPEDKLPSCGALTYLHDGLEVTVRDLVTLMIILSDNTAANLMIDRIGMGRINRLMHETFGLSAGTELRRRLFDSEAASRGLENTVTAADMAKLLRGILERTLVSPEASAAMLGILLDQRLNGKMPFHLHSRGIRTAHKTGEDDGITHDVGIIFAREPVIFCFLANETDVPAAERALQDLALLAAEEAGMPVR